MRQIKVLIILAALFIGFPLNGHAQSDKPGAAADVKPEYNIVIWNLTDGSVNNIVVNYGDEVFNINQIDSFMFKMRNFVDYEVPETVLFQWQDGEGKNYKKEMPMPAHKLRVDQLSDLVFTFIDGNSVSIEWKGIDAPTIRVTPFNPEQRIKDTVEASAAEMKSLIELFSEKGAILTVDEEGNDLCFQYIDPPGDRTCANLGERNTKIKSYKTLEDIIDFFLYLNNSIYKEVSPYNSKPLFTREANSAGQIAVLKAGTQDVKIVSYDNDRNIISEVVVKGP